MPSLFLHRISVVHVYLSISTPTQDLAAQDHLMLLCANILASLDKLTDVFGGSLQGSYNGPAVFVSIFIS